MRMVFLLLVTVLLTISVIVFMGCSEDHIDIIEDMYIEDIEISISEDRPAQVMVTVTVYHSNTCVSLSEIHHERKGNTISIWGTQRVDGSGSDFCGDMVTGVQDQISIGEFGIGEYKVIAGDLELVFHIEDDESWIIRDPRIESIDFSISENVPAQVILNVEGYFCQAGMPFLETRQGQEGDTIYIQITGKVPTNFYCPLTAHGHSVIGYQKYQNQISIGEFEAGHYRVVVNGIQESFVIE